MKFNQNEVGKLIQRASELHESATVDSDPNLSLSEMESIADELGIPTRYLVEAAFEMKEEGSKNSFSLSGAPFKVEHTKFSAGEVSDEQWQEILLELREFSGKTGKSDELGSARRWIHAVGEGDQGFNFEELNVTMRSVEGGTSIRIQKKYDGAVAMYFMAFGMTSFLTLLVAHSLPDITKISELIYAGMGGMLSLGGVRAMVAFSARKYKERLSSLAGRLNHIIGVPSEQVRTPQETGKEESAGREGNRDSILEDSHDREDESSGAQQNQKQRER